MQKMEIFPKIEISVEHKKNVAIVIKNVKDIERFLDFKIKPYLYFPVQKKISFSIRKKFNVIHEICDLHNTSCLETIIMVNIQFNQIYSLIKKIFKSPKIVRVLIIENKKGIKNKNFLSIKNIFDQFELKIISKKKYKKQGKGSLILMIRRKKLPLIVESNFKRLFKFFSLRLNNRLGSVVKKKQFILLISSLNYWKNSIYLESNFLRNRCYKKFRRFSEELGNASARIKYYGMKDFLYIMTYFFLR